MTQTSNQTHAASADEVLMLLRSLVTALEPERMPLADARGCVLREPVVAPEDLPSFDRSSVDGYAVRLDDPAPSFRVVGEIRAGDWKSLALRPGETVRIATGGALPCDDLQVLMQEDVEVESAVMRLIRREPARNIRFRGEDARRGQVLAEPGLVLSPGAMALLASVGQIQPLVTRRSRVRHVATGNEIVSPGQAPLPGQIRDSNSTLVRAFLAQWDLEPILLRVPEDEAQAEAEIQKSEIDTGRVDLLLVSGGASVGEHDFTLRLLEHLGFTIHIRKTATRPGKPLIVGACDNTLAFGLPGNPLAHFVCLNLYVRAALEAWSGQASASPFRLGVLAANLEADGNARETFWPGGCRHDAGTSWLTPLRWSSSGDLTSLATANALIRVPGGSGVLAQGARVEFVPTFSCL